MSYEQMTLAKIESVCRKNVRRLDGEIEKWVYYQQDQEVELRRAEISGYARIMRIIDSGFRTFEEARDDEAAKIQSRLRKERMSRERKINP